MKKKLISYFLCLFIFSALAVLSLYFFAVLRFNDRFISNTFINGENMTGKTIYDADTILCSAYESRNISISMPNGEKETIDIKDLDIKVNYIYPLSEILRKQNRFFWFLQRDRKDFSVNADVYVNEEKLYRVLNGFSLFEPYRETPKAIAEIRYSKDTGYFLNEKKRARIKFSDVFDLVKDAVKKDIDVVLTEEYFEVPEISADYYDVIGKYKSIEPFLEQKIVYDMGTEEITISKAELSDFLVLDLVNRDFCKNEDGTPMINEAAVADFVNKLCDSYDTYKKPRTVKTHLGDEKYIELSTYGTLIDREAELSYLLVALKNGASDKHIPTYLKTGYVRGLDDIGNTLIEVDLTNQILYYIVSGEVIMNCDIVSGKPDKKNVTPEMIAYVYNKQKGRTLRGEGYSSYVDYWMPVYGAIGLHDASWQKKFGGDRYINHGSHGCINMRTEEAKQLYDAIEIGIPVIMYK